MRYIASEEIFEAAWMGCVGKSDREKLYDNMDLWIDEFRAEVNKRLPDGVEVCVKHCSQLGDETKFVGEQTFERILHEAEWAVDNRIDEIISK